MAWWGQGRGDPEVRQSLEVQVQGENLGLYPCQESPSLSRTVSCWSGHTPPAFLLTTTPLPRAGQPKPVGPEKPGSPRGPLPDSMPPGPTVQASALPLDSCHSLPLSPAWDWDPISPVPLPLLHATLGV